MNNVIDFDVLIDVVYYLVTGFFMVAMTLLALATLVLLLVAIKNAFRELAVTDRNPVDQGHRNNPGEFDALTA